MILLVSRSVGEVLQVGLMCACQFCRQESHQDLSRSGGSVRTRTSPSDHFVQCACRHVDAQNIRVTATLMKC